MAVPSRTTRPRTSSASTAKGNTTLSAPSSWAEFIASLSCTSCPETPGKNPFLRVQTVLGLVEDDGKRTVDDVVRHFLAPVCGQAMHEYRVPARSCHKPLIDLIWHQQVVAMRLLLVSHRDPAIGHDGIRLLHCRERVVHDVEFGALLSRPAQDLGGGG